MNMSIHEFFGDDRHYINEENFFPKTHWVEIRPSDAKDLFNRLMKDSVLYGIFYDFLFDKKYDTTFIDNEIDFVVEKKTNLVAILNGTVGTGKSQLSRAIAKKMAFKRGMNIRFITDLKRYNESGHKEGSIKVILDPKFKETMNCYITYRFYETSNLVKVLNEKEMIIQDEVDKSMGTDSKLIKIKIDQVLAITARRHMISVIFNTPLFIPIKNINIAIETFGIRRHDKNAPFTRDDMKTFCILYDKKCSPFAIGAFKVWETPKEHDFYERESKIRKGEFKRTGGGSTVNPDEVLVKELVVSLFKRAASEGVVKHGSLKCLARYAPELVGVETGMLNDVIAFTWDKYSQWLDEGVDPGFPVRFKARKKIGSPIKKTKKGVDDVRPRPEDDAVLPAVDECKDTMKKATRKEIDVADDAKPAKKLDVPKSVLVKNFTETLDSGGFVLCGKPVRVDKDGKTNLKVNDLDPGMADALKEVYGEEQMSDDEVITRDMLIEWYEISVETDRERRLASTPSPPVTETRHREKVVTGAYTREKLVPRTMPLLDFVSKKIREDYGVYEQNLWDLIVGSGMGYDAVAEKLEKDGLKRSHTTVGTDFMAIREGSTKDGKAIGYGYYGELWWANEHNVDGYKYVPPGNDSAPDYIHVDGTVDSVKSYYAFRAIYLTPYDDCWPEYDYCVKNGIKSFRVVVFNFKVSTTCAVIKIVDVSDARRKFKLMPSHFK